MASGTVALIERIYAHLALEEDAWLASIRDACLSTFDESTEGAAAMTVAIAPAPSVDVEALSPDARLLELIHATLATTSTVGTTDALGALRSLLALAPPSIIRSVYLRGPVVSVHAAMRRAGHPEVSELMQSLGVPDWAGAVGVDPSGRGVVLAWARPSNKPMRRGDHHALARVAAHLATAARLRRSATRDEAVISPGGEVQHAEGDARDVDARAALVRAARAIDAARTRSGGLDVTQRIDLWEALVDGRWSLVESFDTDGRRLILARRNDPAARASAMLVERERKVAALVALGHPLKIVAYELGLSEGTVSRQLSSAMRKMGIKTRAQLLEIHGAIVPDSR